MQLKTLELSGFKSFAKRTTIDFTPGVTAVVGPNGSGKSNVVDAIRWVLAEQSFKNLRGKKGEDLIFHGSEKRRALARARVELTLLNTAGEAAIDAEEVVIAREVSRGGESRYLINGTQVRLLDLEEFLARSKVGASSFRILSQGMSDMLLKLGPQELRSYIEEAAGLKEFQDKKERSQKKIERTCKNLDRIEGLLKEIAPNLKFLRRESNKLEKREEIAQRLKKEALALFGYRHRRLAKREREAAEKKKQAQRKVKKLEKEIETLEKEFEGRLQKDDEVEKKEAERVALRRRDHELSRKVVQLEGQLEVVRERGKELRPVTYEYMKKELLALHNKATNKTDNETTLLESVADRIKELLTEIDEGREPTDTSHKEGALKKKLEEVQNELAKTQRKLEEIEEEYGKKQEAASKKRSEIIGREKEYRAKNDLLRDVQRELNAAELEEEKIEVRREQLQHDIESISGITLSEATETAPKKLDEETAEKKVWQLKNKLEKVGGIDEAVKEEYESVKERHNFLEKEKKDLEEAIASLTKMVFDLEQEIEKRFTQTLKEISERFSHNLVLMFNGGAASLSLTGTGKGDEAGIAIGVDLPNKKIKNLGILSGGERTLVSIALLFALTNVRRPPFLVLDEIDAALDEVNSQKFIRLVNNLAKSTQFVIITHNRETMRGADALYGISMKDGISQLLSLKLEQAQEAIAEAE